MTWRELSVRPYQVVSFAAVIEFRWPAFMRDTLVAGRVIRSLST